jgi:hypothetical protein
MSSVEFILHQLWAGPILTLFPCLLRRIHVPLIHREMEPWRPQTEIFCCSLLEWLTTACRMPGWPKMEK